eukprot:CAMPEP_0174737348 /NCGR_PEP_ID=MMETSP1094-20130205/68185_1 /TAXON_ID=156173 /ORGANISM="Chrysochromulina brevifilum, Strain UTEX LB 985" /LENGTH=76 /DNA_ID=CAMNT_0015940573 /DNA_START=527 /DNA_END=757 /DNA_ORIENTATION=-
MRHTLKAFGREHLETHPHKVFMLERDQLALTSRDEVVRGGAGVDEGAEDVLAKERSRLSEGEEDRAVWGESRVDHS